MFRHSTKDRSFLIGKILAFLGKLLSLVFPFCSKSIVMMTLYAPRLRVPLGALCDQQSRAVTSPSALRSQSSSQSLPHAPGTLVHGWNQLWRNKASLWHPMHISQLKDHPKSRAAGHLPPDWTFLVTCEKQRQHESAVLLETWAWKGEKKRGNGTFQSSGCF